MRRPQRVDPEVELRRLFDRLHKLGVTSAYIGECDEEHCAGCGVCIITDQEVMRVLGEMTGVDTGEITEEVLLDAAKRAGVY